MATTSLSALLKQTRSYRRFKPDALQANTLRELVELTRLCASGGNMQPLKYMVSADPTMNAKIFPCTQWAGYLTDWPGPDADERPTGYIVILHDTSIANAPGCDHGIAAQTIMLGAMERGIGGCMIGSLDRDGLADVLGVPETMRILLVLALGVPGEVIKLEDAGGDIKYYRTPDQVHHVPKRAIEELILEPGT